MKAKEIKKAFEEKAFEADRKFFGLSTRVGGTYVPKTAGDYDFSGSNFRWIRVGGQGTANGGWWVPVSANTPLAEGLIRERDEALSQIFGDGAYRSMRSLPGFWEMIEVVETILSSTTEEWRRWFASASINSWREAQEQEVANLATSIPRLQKLQRIIAAVQ